MGFSEHGNQLSGGIKRGHFLSDWRPLVSYEGLFSKKKDSNTLLIRIILQNI